MSSRPSSKTAATLAALEAVQADIRAYRPRGFGPPVHGPAVPSRILLVGQAPGPHEAKLGRPFAWTAGKTLFAWLERATGAPEPVVRERVYIAAVVRCFPGKVSGGGDRVRRGAVRAGVLNLSVPGAFEPHMPEIAQWFKEHPPEDTVD